MRSRIGSRIVLFSALVALAGFSACGGGSSYSSSSPTSPSGGGGQGPTAKADVVIVINGMSGSASFSPANASVKVGQTVAWQNTKGAYSAHDIVEDGAAGFNTGVIESGSTSAAIAITQMGTLTYHCSIHPSMTGSLSVTQ